MIGVFHQPLGLSDTWGSGRWLITYFLLTPDSSRLIEEKASSIDFRYAISGCRVKNKDVPEDAIAYDESKIREFGREAWTEHFRADPLRVVVRQEGRVKLSRHSCCEQASLIDAQQPLVATAHSCFSPISLSQAECHSRRRLKRIVGLQCLTKRGKTYAQ